MVNKIIYLILLLITWFLSIMFTPEALHFLLGFELLLPLIMLIALQFMSRGVKVSMQAEKDQISKGESWTVVIKVENPGWMPLPAIRADLEYTEVQTGDGCIQKVWGKAGSRGTTEIVCRMQEQYCGKVHLNLKQVRIYDYLRLFSKRLQGDGEAVISILPGLYSAEIFQSTTEAPLAMDSEEFDESRPGSDVSEVFQIREYQKGDTLHRIHWKLSAREDELMVKDYSMPLGYRVLIYLNYQIPGEIRNMAAGLDGMIEIAMALSFSMLLEECPHYLFWCTKEGQVERYGIRQEQDLYEAMEAVLGNQVYSESLDGMDLYSRQFPEEMPNLRFTVNMKRELWKKDKLLKTFAETRLRKELESFGLEV